MIFTLIVAQFLVGCLRYAREKLCPECYAEEWCTCWDDGDPARKPYDIWSYV